MHIILFYAVHLNQYILIWIAIRLLRDAKIEVDTPLGNHWDIKTPHAITRGNENARRSIISMDMTLRLSQKWWKVNWIWWSQFWKSQTEQNLLDGRRNEGHQLCKTEQRSVNKQEKGLKHQLTRGGSLTSGSPKARGGTASGSLKQHRSWRSPSARKTKHSKYSFSSYSCISDVLRQHQSGFTHNHDVIRAKWLIFNKGVCV